MNDLSGFVVDFDLPSMTLFRKWFTDAEANCKKLYQVLSLPLAMVTPCW